MRTRICNRLLGHIVDCQHGGKRYLFDTNKPYTADGVCQISLDVNFHNTRRTSVAAQPLMLTMASNSTASPSVSTR